MSNPGTQLSQSPLRSPSVFNFFRPGYVPPGTALSASKTPAPEFQLVNESGVGGYLNYMQGVIRNGIYVNAPDQAGNGSNGTNGYDITAAYSAELALVLDTTGLGGTAQFAAVRRAAFGCQPDADRHRPECHDPDGCQHRQRQTRPRGCRRVAGHGLQRLPHPKVERSMHFIDSEKHTRRAFLRRSGQLALSGTALPFALNLAAIGEAAAFDATDYKALVCVFFYGGNDYANTVVTYDDPSYNLYNTIRGGGAGQTAGGIALAKAALTPTLLSPTTALPGGRQYALHPSMTALAGLFNTGKAAVQLNVGPLVVPLTKAQYNSSDRVNFPLPPKLFSHNDQQSIWQSSSPEGSTVGWGGNLGDLALSSNATSTFTCINVTGNAVFLSGDQALSYQVSTSGAVAINGVKSNVYGSSAVRTAMTSLIQQAAHPHAGKRIQQGHGPRDGCRGANHLRPVWRDAGHSVPHRLLGRPIEDGGAPDWRAQQPGRQAPGVYGVHRRL